MLSECTLAEFYSVSWTSLGGSHNGQSSNRLDAVLARHGGGCPQPVARAIGRVHRHRSVAPVAVRQETRSHPVGGRGFLMSNVRNCAAGSAVAALVLASPAVALLIVIVAEMPIDLLMNLGALALLGLTTIGALGWFALQRQSSRSGGALSSNATHVSEGSAPVSAPPM